MKKIWGHWVFSNTCFRIETPNASTTCVMYAGATDTACGGTIGYEVCFGNDIYHPGIGFGYDLSRRMRPHVTLSAPSVLFNNDDADPVIDDDRAPVRIGFECDSAYATNGTLRLTASGVTLWASQAAADRMPLGTTLTFPDFSTQSNLTLYVDRTGGASQAMDDLSLTLEWIEGLAADSEGQFSSNGAARVVHTMTALEPVMEPICNLFKTVNGTNHVINPCCVVHGGRDAYFQIRNIPDWFPQERVVWSCDDPAVQFVGGNTGTSVCVRATGPTQYGGEDYPALSVQIGDACSSVPKCYFVTVPEVTTIRLYPHFVMSSDIPIAHPSTVSNYVSYANDVYSQIGMEFVYDEIITNHVHWTRSNVIYTNSTSRAVAFSLANHTKGIDVLFLESIDFRIKGFADCPGRRVALNSFHCSRSTLAHELGHCLGWKDILRRRKRPDGAYEELSGLLRPQERLSVSDLCNGTGNRYYGAGLSWNETIARLIMCGNALYDNRVDIPHGGVEGCIYTNVGELVSDYGFAQIGLVNIDAENLCRIKEGRAK